MRQAVDGNGEVVAKYDYDPYGNPIEDENNSYGFTGEWWESELGLLHLRARWYMPEVGVFLSRDPIESESSYTYVRGNPINKVDPSGLREEEGAGNIREYPLYCYNLAQRKLTRNNNRFRFCAPDVDASENRAEILSRIASLQPQLPSNTWWAELDQGWGYSVYVTANLIDEEAVEKVPVYDITINDNIELGQNWIERVKLQGAGYIPSGHLYGNRIVRYDGQGKPYLQRPDDLSLKTAVADISNMAHLAVAAPRKFPFWTQLFAPNLVNHLPNNPSKVFTVLDRGGSITYDNRVIDIYHGIDTVMNGINYATRWGSLGTRHSTWILVETKIPLTDECSLPSEILNVNPKLKQ